MSNSIVLVPMNETYDLKWFANMLSRTLARTQSAVVLDSQNISRGNSYVAQATPNSILERSLLHSLARYTEKYQTQIYITDKDWSNWSERWLSSKMQIFLIGAAGSEAPLTPVAKELMYQQDKISAKLILEYPTKILLHKKHNSNTLKPRGIQDIHAFAKNNLTDFENIVRLITNKKQSVNYETRKSVA